MKILVQMKDPDVLHDAIEEAVKESLVAETPDPQERDAIKEIRIAKIGRLAAKWFEYGEYLTVEIDTEAETCTVVSLR